jgi:hypothetical protein
MIGFYIIELEPVIINNISKYIGILKGYTLPVFGLVLSTFLFFYFRPDRWLVKQEYIIGSLRKKVRRERRDNIKTTIKSIPYYIRLKRLELRKLSVKIKLPILLLALFLSLFVTPIIYYAFSLPTDYVFTQTNYQIEVALAAGSLVSIIFIFLTNYVSKNLETVAAEIYLAWSVLGLRLVIVGCLFLVSLKATPDILSELGDLILLPVAATTALGVLLSLSSMAKFPLYGGIINIQEKLARRAVEKKKNAEINRAIAKDKINKVDIQAISCYSDETSDSSIVLRAQNLNISPGITIHDIKLSDTSKDIGELTMHVVPGDVIQSENQPIASCEEDADLEKIEHFLQARILTSWASFSGSKPDKIDDSDIISDYLSKLEGKCKNAIRNHHSRVFSYCIKKYGSLIREYRIHSNTENSHVDREIEAVESLLRVYNMLEEEKQNNESLDRWNNTCQNKIREELLEIISEIDDDECDVRKKSISVIEKMGSSRYSFIRSIKKKLIPDLDF